MPLSTNYGTVTGGNVSRPDAFTVGQEVHFHLLNLTLFGVAVSFFMLGKANLYHGEPWLGGLFLLTGLGIFGSALLHLVSYRGRCIGNVDPARVGESRELFFAALKVVIGFCIIVSPFIIVLVNRLQI